MDRASHARTRSLYETVADSYAEAVPDADVEPGLDVALIRDFTQLLADQGDVPVLDAGCGTGRLTGHLRTLNPAISPTGVDLSPAMLEHARRRNPGMPFVEADLADLPFADEHFAGVLAWYSIIHTAPHELPRVFAELRRVLRSGGLLLIGYQSGVGERVRAGAYGHEVELHAYLHCTAQVEAALVGVDMMVDTKLDRGPRRQERLPQGFILARRA